MMDSIIRSYNLVGQVIDFESDAAANPPPRLVATAGSTPMRALCTSTGGVLVAFDQAQLRNLSVTGVNADTFPVDDDVFILAPGQRLYAVNLGGGTLINVATSDSVQIAEVLSQASRASGTPSRLFRVNFRLDFVTGAPVPFVVNNPPILAAAPDWSPMRVTVFLPRGTDPLFPTLALSEDADLLRQGAAGSPFTLRFGQRQTFVLAPNQTLYGIVTASNGGVADVVPVQVSTTLFTDVFNPKALAALPDTQVRALWNNLWQGSDGVCF
jgi:hypothetical protein